MSQTKEQIEQELESFKNENLDWRTIEWKANTVTGFNNRLASFTGKNLCLCLSHVNFILLINHFIASLDSFIQ
jgi:hypothetical protein